MGRFFKKTSFFLRRKAHLPLIIIGGIVILLLFFNEETSISQNMKYEAQIKELKNKIARCQDSTAFYQHKKNALLYGKDDLEHVAREQYNMQRPTEDVFIINP